MSRKNLPHYSGASGRITIENLTKLGSAFVVQPKHDGMYVHAILDSSGCISRVISRTGRNLPADVVADLVGQFVGYPNAVLAGELTAHTEAGMKEAKKLGQRRIHVFDMPFGYQAEPLHGLSYRERRDQLRRMQAKVQEFGWQNPYTKTKHGTRTRKDGRFAKRRLHGWQLTPIVEQVTQGQSGELWDKVKAGELEELVAVSLNAKIRARNSKKKCKPVQFIDANVLSCDSRTAICWHMGKTFPVSLAKKAQKGDVVEVQLDGWYSTGEPRFPRIKRVRHDLMIDHT